MSLVNTMNKMAEASILGYPAIRVAVTLVVLYSIYRVLQIGRRDKRMPPGPPTLPILGNIHQIPITGMYKK